VLLDDLAREAAPTVDIVVPVRDEERILAFSVRRLAAYLRDHFPYTARITIAENGSSDATWEIAQALAAELEGVRAIRAGRRRARRGAARGLDRQRRRGARLHGR
jgi:glycosyltransferase involved in cell wall biosynthesis